MTSKLWMGFGAAALMVAQFAFAQQMPKTTKQDIAGASSEKTETLNGTVVAVEEGKLIVRMSSGDIRMFEPPADRKFIIDGKELTIRDLRPGTKLKATVTTTTTPVTERTTTVGTGRVWFVSGNTVILTLPNGENRQYKVNDSYKFNIGGQKASVHELKKGMTVSAEKIVESQKMVIASNVAVTGSAPPAPKPQEVAEARPMPAPRPAPAPAAARAPEPAPAPVAAAAPAAKLPATGSPMPLAGLLGIVLVGASYGIRKFRR